MFKRTLVKISVGQSSYVLQNYGVAIWSGHGKVFALDYANFNYSAQCIVDFCLNIDLDLYITQNGVDTFEKKILFVKLKVVEKSKNWKTEYPAQLQEKINLLSLRLFV